MLHRAWFDRGMGRWLTAGLFAALVCVPMVARAELEDPTANDRQITLVVTALMRQEHLTRHPLDEEIAGRAIKSFLKTLDSWKLYFTQADADEFLGERDEMLRQIRRGDVDLAWKVFRRLLERIDERAPTAIKYIDADHDFTVDEEIVSDPDLVKYSVTPAEMEEKWRKRIKFELMVLNAEGTPVDEAKDKLKRRYSSFAKRMHQFDNDDLRELYLTSLTTAYDPHSTYMAPEQQENFDILMSLELEGIGAQLEFEDGYTLVNKIIPGGAADKDGRLKPKDKITGVGQGEAGDIVDVVEMKLSDVVHLVRGKRGTTVRLEVVPAGDAEKKIYNITRAQIELSDSEAHGEVIEETRDGQAYRLGVINLPSFYMDMEKARMNVPDYKSTTRDVSKLIDDFRKKKVDVVVIDLRRNGGGSLTEAISLTGLFIDTGPVVQVKDKDGRKHPYNDQEAGMGWDGPLVVLTSKFSASASEIFAGAIQDYKRGLIIGDETTHGKGTVQSLLDLGRQMLQLPNTPEMGALKITMQQFYRPSGESTQNRGVHADVVLPSLTNELEGVGESDLDYALAFDQIEAADFKPVNMLDKSMIDRLQSMSSKRCTDSDEFQRVARNIKRYHEQQATKAIPLNESTYMSERFNPEKDQQDELEKLESDDAKIKRDFYFDEALNVAIDFLELAKQAHTEKAPALVGQVK